MTSAFFRFVLPVFFVLLLLHTVNAQETKTVFGTGIGTQTSGFGFNMGIADSTDLKYASIGIRSLSYSGNVGFSFQESIGVGWVVSDLLSKSNTNNGIGLHLGASREYIADGEQNIEMEFVLFYSYFFQGIGQPGWQLGIGADLLRLSGSSVLYFIRPSFGYQF